MKKHNEFWWNVGETDTKPWLHVLNQVDQQDNAEYWNQPDQLKSDNAKATVEEAREDWLAGITDDIGKGSNKYIDLFIKYDMPEEPTIIEIGCGGGRNLLPLYALNYFNFVGIDHAQGAIDVCKARMPKGEFHCIGAESLPLDDRRFDLIFSHTALQHNSGWKLHKVIPSIRATLKEGGILWLQNELTIDGNIYFKFHQRALPMKPYMTDYRGSHGTAAWWIGMICDHGFELLSYQNSEYVFKVIK